MSQVELRKLPLFPLNTVLFPGMMLPLHIFEPRYRLMINRCLKLNDPFGVVLIREGQEVGRAAEPYNVGTTAYITHSEREPDGRLQIRTVGYQRFRIERLEQREPYLVGLVEDFPVEGTEASEIASIVKSIRPGLRVYLNTLSTQTDTNFSFEEIPDDGLALAYFIAITLPIPVQDKQKILTEQHLVDMLTLERTLLGREISLLDSMIQQHQSHVANNNLPFSSN